MYSRGRMIAFAILLVPVMIWMTMATQGSKIVSTEHVRGRVESFEALPVKDASQSPQFKTTLRLPDGKSAVLTVYTYPPEKGAQIPVVVQTRADGKRHIYADAD